MGFSQANIKWFIGGKLNVSYNCLDRHVEAGAGGQTAMIWQGNDAGESRKLTYAELLGKVCRFANALKSLGVKKGDRVCHLHADGARTGRGDAGLYPHRRSAFGGVRRVFCGVVT